MVAVRRTSMGFALGACGPTVPAVAPPAGFRFVARDDGTVIITHNGRDASTLRGRRAVAFLAEVAGGDPQLVMARWTGNYKRGNERVAAEHPRNRRR
jgi:hypothetical protein